MAPSREQVAALLGDLVSTYSPSGQEEEACGVLQGHLEAWGLACHRDAVGNVHAHVPGQDPEAPHALLLGHIDTVPGQLPLAWKDGTLWGRGAVDAKGPLVAHAVALASLDGPAAQAVRLVAAVGEETDSRGAHHLRRGPAPEALVIAEPTGPATVGLGYKGCLRGRLVATEPPSHPGHPDPSASERLLQAIQALTAWTGNPERDPGVEHTTLRVTGLSHHQDPHSEEAIALVDLRLPGQVPEIAQMEQVLPEGVTFELAEAMPAAFSSPRDPVATALRGSLLAGGQEPRMVRKTGSSDWNVVAPSWSCPAAAFGPGDPALDHTDREHIHLDEVLGAGTVLASALQRLDLGRAKVDP